MFFADLRHDAFENAHFLYWGDACIASCTGNSACAGFWFNGGFSGDWFCTLYSAIEKVDTGFGTMFVKVCGDNTAPAISPASILVSLASSETLSIAATSSSISTTVQTISSASPSVSVCPYLDYPECPPIDGTSLVDACPTSDNKCTSGYRVGCGSSISDRATMIGSSSDVRSTDSCAKTCDYDPACLGFQFTIDSNSCIFYNKLVSVQKGGSNTVLYTKKCPSTQPIVSSSSLQASSTTAATSSTLASGTTPSASSGTPSPTECPWGLNGSQCPLTDTTLAEACLTAKNKCRSKYKIVCGDTVGGKSSMVSHAYDTPVDAHDCATQCDDNPTCAGFVYSRKGTNDGHFTCK